MTVLEKIKLDTWWKIVLLLGIGAIVSSLFFEIVFLQNKHLFGLGLGMICVGISFWIAEKKKSAIKPPNAYTGPSALISWKETRHNFVSIVLLMFGLICICVFGFLIVIKLI